MRYLLLFIAFFGYSIFSFSATVSSSRDTLNGEFSFTEGNFLLTEISTDFGQIDNFLRSHNAPQETNFFELSPELFMQIEGSGSLFQIQAKAGYFTYDEFSKDNHYDFSVLSKYHLSFAQSHKVFVTGFIEDNYEFRGTGLSLGEQNALEEGDTKRNEFLNMGYLYGHQASLARAKLLVGYRDFSYLTRKNITNEQAYSANYLQGNFDYFITGKTYFSTKVQYEDFNYSLNQNLERKQYVALVGVKWQSTELTKLLALVGYENTVFANDTFGEKKRFAWQVNMLWNPIERIRFKFSSGSEVKDSFKVGESLSFVKYHGMELIYGFNQQLLLSISGKVVNGEVVDIDSEINEDHFESTTRIQYQWRDWLSAYAQYRFDSFDSTVVTNNYDLQVISLGVVVTF